MDPALHNTIYISHFISSTSYTFLFQNWSFCCSTVNLQLIVLLSESPFYKPSRYSPRHMIGQHTIFQLYSGVIVIHVQ